MVEWLDGGGGVCGQCGEVQGGGEALGVWVMLWILDFLLLLLPVFLSLVLVRIATNPKNYKRILVSQLFYTKTVLKPG